MEEYERAFYEDFKLGDFTRFKNEALKNSSKPSFKKLWTIVFSLLLLNRRRQPTEVTSNFSALGRAP